MFSGIVNCFFAFQLTGLPMKNSKLLDILDTFDPSQLTAFKDFLVSPYFNKREILSAFYAQLLEEGRPIRPTKISIFEQLFPGQKYDDKQIRYLMSDLCKLAEAFLLHERYRNQAQKRRLDLATIYNEKKLDKYYRQEVRKLESYFANNTYRDALYFEDHLHFSMLKDTHFQQMRVRRFDDNLQWASDDLDRYYFLQKLRHACIMLDRQAIITADYQLAISEDWLRHLQAKGFFGELIIELYHTILLSALEEDKDVHFTKLKQLLAGDSTVIPNQELADIYRFAINYCARKIRKGEAKFVEEALSLYVKGIESQLFLEENHLSPWTFTNVVKLALRLARYDWIASFIPTYAPLLPPGFQENALHYNYAELYYYTKDFDQALTHLNQVAYDDINYTLGARVMLAKIYFETDAENALLSLLAAFSVFLKRNKNISSNIKHTYLNFCDLLFQLVRRKPKKMKDLKQKIVQTHLLTDRAWLLDAYQAVNNS